MHADDGAWMHDDCALVEGGKLGVDYRIQAAVLAVRLGLVDEQDVRSA